MVAISRQHNARVQRIYSDSCVVCSELTDCIIICDERLSVCTNGNEFGLQLAAAHTLMSDFPFSNRLDFKLHANAQGSLYALHTEPHIIFYARFQPIDLHTTAYTYDYDTHVVNR